MNRGNLFFLCIYLLVFLSLNSPNIYASDNLLEKGIEEYKAENYEESLDILLAVRSQQPDSSIAAFYLGLAFKQVKDYKQAEIHLRDAVRLIPPVKDAYIELAEVLFTLDKLKEAEVWIARAEKEGIKPANTLFLKGLILLKEGKTEQAAEAFRRAKQLDPSLSQPADLQIAMAQIAAQRFEDAKKSLRTIQDIDPTSDLASFAQEYEKALDRTLRTYKPWQFRLGVACQYDDNVVLKPSSDISGVLISGEKDGSIVGTFGVSYSPLLNGPYFLNFKYDIYTDTYFKTDSHNLLIQTVSLNPGVNVNSVALSLPVSYSYALVQQEGYMGLGSVKPTVQIAFRPEHIGVFSVGYERRELLQAPINRDENRDGNIFSISAGYIHPFKEGKGIFNIAYEFTDDDAEGKNWANLGNRFSLSLLLPGVVKKTNLILSGDMFLQDYKNTHTAFGVKRMDRTYTASATIIVALLKNVNLNVQYTHITADSNVAVYDYSRNIYTVGVEYKF